MLLPASLVSALNVFLSPSRYLSQLSILSGNRTFVAGAQVRRARFVADEFERRSAQAERYMAYLDRSQILTVLTKRDTRWANNEKKFTLLIKLMWSMAKFCVSAI